MLGKSNPGVKGELSKISAIRCIDARVAANIKYLPGDRRREVTCRNGILLSQSVFLYFWQFSQQLLLYSRKELWWRPRESRRRDLKWTRCGRSHCRITGSWATSSAFQWMRETTSGSFIGKVRSKPWKTTRLRIRRDRSDRKASWNRNAAR